MKSKLYKFITEHRQDIVLGCIILAILSIPVVFVWKTSIDKEYEEVRDLNLADFPLSTQIHITGSTWASIAATYEWCKGGPGTDNTNEYYIEDVILDAQGGSFHCLLIESSSVFFRIENCIFTNTQYSGIVLNSVSNGSILSNTISTTDGAGISLNFCSDNKIIGNTVENNNEGIKLYYSDNNYIKNNEILHNEINGMTLEYSDRNEVLLNDIYENENINNPNTKGIYMIESYYNNITSNNINDNDAQGIHLSGCYYNNISDNFISGNLQGFKVDISQYNTFFNNTIENTGLLPPGYEPPGYEGSYRNGMFFSDSDNNNITENTIKNTQHKGLYFDSSDYSYIKGNSIELSKSSGIVFENSLHNKVIDNAVNNSVLFGISLINSEDNIVLDNFLSKCGYNIEGSPGLISNLIMNTSNLVNGKPLHFYYNSANLDQNNFTNSGQIILYSCYNADISGFTLNECTRGLSLYYCNNYHINGITSALNFLGGIYLKNCNNGVILGSNLSYTVLGLHMYNTNSTYVSGNTINYNHNALNITEGYHNRIVSNTINHNDFSGIGISSSTFWEISFLNNSILGNTLIKNNGPAVRVSFANKIIISDNIINDNLQGINLNQANNVTILDNSVTYNDYGGIYILDCSDLNITRNTVSHNYNPSIYPYSQDVSGIRIKGDYIGSSRITLIENTINNNHEGISIYHVSKINAIGNSLYSSDIALNNYVKLEYCDDSNFTANELELYGWGFDLYYCVNNLFTSNEIRNGGIDLYRSDYNEFIDNYICCNGIAFLLSDSSHNKIINNTLYKVQQCFVEWGDSTDNIFENNDCLEELDFPPINLYGAIIGLCGVGIVTTIMLIKRNKAKRK